MNTLKAPVVIFVQPQNEGNVGAIARVMSNFHCSELRLVQRPQQNEHSVAIKGEEIDWALACKGKDILENAKVYETLGDALEGVQWAVGSTARPRDGDSGYTRECHSTGNALKITSLKIDKADQWALIIGREDSGLIEEDLALCNLYTYIPTSDKSPAMNAAMAAGCMLYHWNEFFREASAENKTVKIADDSKASLKDIDQLSEYVVNTLKLSEFFKYPNQGAVKARITRFFQEKPPTRGDLLFVFEIFYQLKSKIIGEFEKRKFLS